jgi:ribosomal protein L37AE/L43A
MFFFLCAVYNQIQHKLQMSWHREEENDPGYSEYLKRMKARAAAETDRAAAAARVIAASGTADTIAENEIRRQTIHQEIDKIVCPDCKRTARMLEAPDYKCTNCRQTPQGGYKRKSKSQRRKKSKSQRRRKSIKRRH